MMDATMHCDEELRRHQVRRMRANGIDYIEVSNDQRTLTVHFIDQAPTYIVKENVVISGGRRITDIRVLDLRLCLQEEEGRDDCMKVVVDRPGDFSTYTLCLRELDKNGRPTEEPLRGFDPRYACRSFTFKAGCPTDLDCAPTVACPPEKREEPSINYLAKDYASFRSLLLDRLSLIMPDWKERHVPDIGITLVEILAYVGDHLSYYQDAVGTEAYLDTARRRVSVRRHARLVDYMMHEGCNARAWVTVETSESQIALSPREIFFITRPEVTPELEPGLLLMDDLARLQPSVHYEIFEPLVPDPDQPVIFRKAHNTIQFYTWGDTDCCLPRGATSATLKDGWILEEPPDEGSEEEPGEPKPEEPGEPKPEEPKQGEMAFMKHGFGDLTHMKQLQRAPQRELQLRVGDVLIFEEVIGPRTGSIYDADPAHRHAVLLTKVEPGIDPLYRQPIVEIEWSAADALPFPICISTLGNPPECTMLENVSVARGNVVLVDHGRTIAPADDLGTVPTERTEMYCQGPGRPSDISLIPGAFDAALRYGPLVFGVPLAESFIGAPSATGLRSQDPHRALPHIELTSDGTAWTSRYDLLGSGAEERHFVVEMESDGRAHLRFGDGEIGMIPPAGSRFTAVYRVGGGIAGNVGADSIRHLVVRSLLEGVMLKPRNPLPAYGGTEPEPIAEVKLRAPFTFRKDLQRAVSAEDYARIAERHPRVQRAAASLRWTGSWYEVWVAIDAKGTEVASPELLAEVEGMLHRYRRVGHDLRVLPARYVALDIELTVCVSPHYLRGHVRAALLEVFTPGTRSDGTPGFFHPDNLTFGDGIHLSRLIAAAHTVEGVESVRVTRLQRLFEAPNEEIENGVLPLSPLEVARLDNDPSFPENGKLKLIVRGGR